MAHAAVKKKSFLQGLTLPVYFAGLVLVLAFDPDHSGTQEFLFGLGMTTNMGIGLMHAIGIRSWVFADVLKKSDGLRDQQAQALARLREQQHARQAARTIAVQQPFEARRLAIGRPDIPNRAYPDGGLVDVNLVPVHVLTNHLYMQVATAQRIVALRDRVDEFSSYEDLLMLTDLDPRELDPVAEFMVFIRLRR